MLVRAMNLANVKLNLQEPSSNPFLKNFFLGKIFQFHSDFGGKWFRCKVEEQALSKSKN